MKIFNWVHRRFNSRAAENGKKNVDIGGEDEKKGNVLEHWRGGILTIGTFGYDPLKDESYDDDQINYDHVCNEEEEEDDELAHVEHYHDDVDDDSEEDGEDDEEDEEEEEEKPNLVFAGCYEEEEEEEEKRSWELGYEYVMMEKKARTTLADLFLHAHEDTTATTFNHDQLSKKTKTTKKKKKHLLLDQLGPIHKLNKLMRRMLKRKIHPADIGVHNSKVTDINDHASLLIPTHHQDVII